MISIWESLIKQQWNGKIYHYIFNNKLLNKILKSGELKPANLSRQDIEKYAGREGLKTADEYFIHAYDYFYGKPVGKPYKNYGIYLTTVDLFSFPNNLNMRFNIPFERLTGDTVIQLGKKDIKLVRSKEDIRRMANQFMDPNKIEKIYNTPGLKFKHLPQVVNFSDGIPVSKNDLEYRK